MQINKHSPNTRKPLLYVIAGLVIFTVLAGLGYFIFQHYYGSKAANSPSDTATTDSPETKKQNTSSKEDFINNVKLPTQKEDTDKEPPKDQSSNISIDLSQQDGDVIIATKLPGYSDGTCQITAINGTRKYSDSADILYQPSSTCMGFNIPITELGAGTWTITLKASGTGTTGTSTKSIKVVQ